MIENTKTFLWMQQTLKTTGMESQRKERSLRRTMALPKKSLVQVFVIAFATFRAKPTTIVVAGFSQRALPPTAYLSWKRSVQPATAGGADPAQGSITDF